MGDRLRRFMQVQSNIDADRIMEEVNADPEVQDVHAPDVLYDSLFAQIDTYEKEKSHSNLTDEERELMELGKKFKKRSHFRKQVAAIFLVCCVLGATGITAMGGPERLMEKVEWILAGREQTNVDSDDERVEEMASVSEAEAFAEIEEKFGFAPVRMHYLPDGMEFRQKEVLADAHDINFFYKDKNDNIIVFTMHPDFRVCSMGEDFEDTLVEEFGKERDGVFINVKEYSVKENSGSRWIIDFEYRNVYYYLKVIGLNSEEIEKIIDGLFFER